MILKVFSITKKVYTPTDPGFIFYDPRNESVISELCVFSSLDFFDATSRIIDTVRYNWEKVFKQQSFRINTSRKLQAHGIQVLVTRVRQTQT